MTSENWISKAFWGFLKKTAIITGYGLYFFYSGLRLQKPLEIFRTDNPLMDAITFALGAFFGTWIFIMAVHWFFWIIWFTTGKFTEFLSVKINQTQYQKRKRDYAALYADFSTNDKQEDSDTTEAALQETAQQ